MGKRCSRKTRKRLKRTGILIANFWNVSDFHPSISLDGVNQHQGQGFGVSAGRLVFHPHV